MSKLPSMPLFVDDYEAATAHLTLEEDGAYSRLLRLCWRSPECSIPDDDAWIARRLRVSLEDFERVVRPILAEFFTRQDGRVFQGRQQREHEYVTGLVERRKEAGKRGGKAKALKANENEPSKPNDLLLAKGKQSSSTHTHTHTHKEGSPNGEPARTRSSRGTRLPEDWFLPREWGEWAVSEGWPETVIREQAETFRDYWRSVAGAKGVKLDWFATWRNWLRRVPKQEAQNGKRRTPGSDPNYQARLDKWAEYDRLRAAKGIPLDDGFGTEEVDFGSPEAERAVDHSGGFGATITVLPPRRG